MKKILYISIACIFIYKISGAETKQKNPANHHFELLHLISSLYLQLTKLWMNKTEDATCDGMMCFLFSQAVWPDLGEKKKKKAYVLKNIV